MIKFTLFKSKKAWIISSLLAVFSILSIGYATDSLTESRQGPNFYPPYPALNIPKGVNPELVKQGEYLVKAGDCIACHTNMKEGGQVFAGGLPLQTPFGTFFSPNITPDKQTGIGNWSLNDFINAMHHGVRPDGKNYFPVFPYTSFTKVSKQDLIAIKAYLDAIPAVHKPNKEPTAPWPFSWRFAQTFWRWMFFHQGYYQYDNSHSALWNRGAYLVQGLGHCGECHTPRNFLGAMKNKYYLTGAMIDGYWAPNITSLEFRDTPLSDIIDVFDKDQLINKAGPVAGPMKEVDHNSLKNLSQADLDAIALYLKSVNSIQVDSSHSMHRPKANKSMLRNGERVYNQACAMCHDKGVAGAPLLYDAANWYSRLQQGLPVLYQHVIQGFNQMPAMGACLTCSKNDIQDAVDYILNESLSKIDVHAIQGAQIAKPDISIERGQIVYEKHCANCHDQGYMGAQKLKDPTLLTKPLDVLVNNTLNGIGNMPPKGGCKNCSNSDVIAAVKYMAAQANPKKDYSLW